MNLAVTGATGRMGRTVIATAGDHDETTVSLAVARTPPDHPVEGVPVHPDTDLTTRLEADPPDTIVDFTSPDATTAYARAAADHAIPFVTGTTGLTPADHDALADHATTIPVLHATNFSRGIHALLTSLPPLLNALPGYDIELLETHHHHKQDAPSGTAHTILEHIHRTRDITPVHGRHGTHPRAPEEVGVHARRAGDIRGEHELLLAANDELLTITHRAESRRVYAAGALDAARWLLEQPPGSYTFTDVVTA